MLTRIESEIHEFPIWVHCSYTKSLNHITMMLRRFENFLMWIFNWITRKKLCRILCSFICEMHGCMMEMQCIVAFSLNLVSKVYSFVVRFSHTFLDSAYYMAWCGKWWWFLIMKQHHVYDAATEHHANAACLGQRMQIILWVNISNHDLSINPVSVSLQRMCRMGEVLC